MRWPIWRGKETKKETPKRAGVLPQATQVAPPAPMFNIFEKFKNPPSLIFVGSSKGGVGKSMITTNLAIILAALGNSIVHVVDLDLDNYTATYRLPKKGELEEIAMRYYKSGGSTMPLNVAQVLIETSVRSSRVGSEGLLVTLLRQSVADCNKRMIDYSIRLVPAYDVIHMRDQMLYGIRGLSSSLYRAGMETLIKALVEEKNKLERSKKRAVFLFDGKQKSNIGIEYEPLYRTVLTNADAFILVTEPGYLSINEVLAPYMDYLDKTVIIVNKFEPNFFDKVAIFIRDAAAKRIPVFVIPKDTNDEKLYDQKNRPPAAFGLSRRTALFTMALAYSLKLIDDEHLAASGCMKGVRDIIELHRELYGEIA